MQQRSPRRPALFGLLAFVVATALAAPAAHALQKRFEPGDRVVCNSTQSTNGPWDAGTVVAYTDQDRQLDPAGIQSGRYYRVNLDKYPAFLNPVTCMANFIRSGGAAAADAGPATGTSSGQSSAADGGNPLARQPGPAAPDPTQVPPQPRPDPAASAPPGAGDPAPRDLRGTAWKIESRGSIGVQVFLFCNSGRWEIVGSQLLNGAVSPVGTYQQSGSRLTTRNQDDGMVTNWSLRWPGGDALDIDDGRVTLRLRYNGRTSC